MPMKRGIWLILAAVVLVLIGLFVRSPNRTPETPPATQTPAAATGGRPAKSTGDAGATRKDEQKAASAPSPEAVQRETAPAPQAAPPSQASEKETAPEPAPWPATASSSRTAGNETPAPATTAPTGTAPTSEKEAAPASPSATAVQTAPKEAAPASASQPAAAPSTQTAENESVPGAASPLAAAPTAPAGEKAPVATDKDAEPHANDEASAAAQTAIAPEPAPRPATAPSSRTAGNETPPASAPKEPTATAPASEREAAPASSSATAVQTAHKEAAPASASQPAARPSTQTAEMESVPAAASSAAAPAAPAGEKAPVVTDKDAEPHANDKASAELAALQPGFVPKDLVAALNDSVISFASDSADLPASMTGFLQKAAEDLKQLPKGHVVEIAGYTDNTGDQALNGALSQKRAEAVRQALIKFGADPEMLIAKGYGSADPVASNDTPEGRQRNRRIEYHIVKTP
jgi:outer membrane protein OmpA-like peptidoglycan-associated protein